MKLLNRVLTFQARLSDKPLKAGEIDEPRQTAPQTCEAQAESGRVLNEGASSKNHSQSG